MKVTADERPKGIREMSDEEIFFVAKHQAGKLGLNVKHCYVAEDNGAVGIIIDRKGDEQLKAMLTTQAMFAFMSSIDGEPVDEALSSGAYVFVCSISDSIKVEKELGSWYTGFRKVFEV